MATKETEKQMTKLILSRAETAERLGAQVLRDALAAGWIKPRALKPGRAKNLKVLFALVDIERVETRILKGEYPTRSKPNWLGQKSEAEPL